MRPRLWYEIPEMARIPRGYAVAWMRIQSLSAICLPVGLHVLVGMVRAAWLAFRAWRAPDVLERAYIRGRVDGARAAQRYADQMRPQIERAAIDRFVQERIAEIDAGRFRTQ